MSIGHARESIYDQLRPHLDAADLIRRLGLNLKRSMGSEAYCEPLCHQSTSGESLQVNLQTGRWNCKACQDSGVYGDLIQLVEYVLTGGAAPSRGQAQGASAQHREAVEWLCTQFGVAYSQGRHVGDAALDVVHVVAMSAHEYLLKSPEALAFILDKWGFDESTVRSYGIGYMPSPILPEIAAEAARPESRDAFRSSGMGWFTGNGSSWHTHFEGRIIFPYLEHGRAVYMIGRTTPWTPKPEGGRRVAKYHKLSVHSETRPYISKSITNDHLYNEPVMRDAPRVVIAEGVADAVALSALGVPVVSPVTISFNAVDLERFTRKAAEFGIAEVEILFDNELSGSGNWAARRAGLKLVERGLAARVLTLPLGQVQEAARDEVRKALGDDVFEELERSAPHVRKRIIEDAAGDAARRTWIIDNIEASKIDAAEWTASVGAGAPGKFDEIRKKGRDVVELEIEDAVADIDSEARPHERANALNPQIELAAHVESRMIREGYAKTLADAAGKGVTTAEMKTRIASARRMIVKPKREEAKNSEAKVTAADFNPQLLPPMVGHTQKAAPVAPVANPRPGAKPAPTLPVKDVVSEHDYYEPARDSVHKMLNMKVPDERIGEFVAQTILRSMGYTPFKTPEELYLVRGSKRVAVDTLPRSDFRRLLMVASGMTPRKSSHGGAIASVEYFLAKDSRRVSDVSWSFYDEDGDEATYFPQGDELGSILKIEPGIVSRTKMAEVRVPAVAGQYFKPFRYVEDAGGISSVLDAFAWTSLSGGDRLVLVYWIVCLPILRRIGTVPIVRIEGGSGSGKTRTVDAVSFLVNGCKGTSVPTAAALASRMSTEMLTVDDNRETGDVSPSFLSTLLQATHLGAREKRKNNSDTGTVIERVCGALLMNGIEPIHDGRSELASRILILRCIDTFKAAGSPTANRELMQAIVARRDAFWSESPRRCAWALAADRDFGEALGVQIEEAFGATRIGRLSSYIRIMYFAWCAGLDERLQAAAVTTLSDVWREALEGIGHTVLGSLIAEELSVSAVSYAFRFGRASCEPEYTGADLHTAFDGRFRWNKSTGELVLGPMRASTLAKLARHAGKELNAPRAVSTDLRAGQLERRLLDGLPFLKAAGFAVDVVATTKGRNRFTFMRQDGPDHEPTEPAEPGKGDTWVGP